MQLPETPPPPLAPLWDRVLRARALPPDLDVELLYVAIRDRLGHPEWEVRLHALRVLADLLPLSGNALSFPFDQVVDNLGHSSPNVRKAALDALKVFCTHCEDAECAARAILDKCSYHNIRPHSANVDNKINVVTGLILSIPSVMGILKRRHPGLDIFPIFQILGEKLFDTVHRDVAQRSLIKLRRICGPRDYMMTISRLDPKVQEKFRILCETYDEDSMDVYYAPRKSALAYRENNNQPLVKVNHVFNGPITAPLRLSTDSSSDDSRSRIPFYNNNYAKVIIETEIKFDSDTAITMTVLEENEESERNTGSDDDYDSSDLNMLKYSDGDSEDTDVVVKKVRFGGESVKIRTPDSDNLITSEDDNRNKTKEKDHIDNALTPVTSGIVNKMNEIKREAMERELHSRNMKKSGIPLPVIQNRPKNIVTNYSRVKLKSKSLSELYDYFRTKNDVIEENPKEDSGFALTLTEVHSPEKVPSPVEPHKEIEVLHNLQRSPVVSPRRQQTQVILERDGFVLNLLASSPPSDDLMSPRPPTPLRPRYDWEELDIVPRYVVDQLHNTENWIAAVKAADQLHSTLLDPDNVRRVEPAALSLVQHMWALSDAVAAAKAPAEGAVCALVRAASNDCARQLLPVLIARMTKEPLPAALPHALLQRLALHHIVDLIFDPNMIGITTDIEEVHNAQLRATLCLARAAGPAAVLSAVRRRLAGTTRADMFCNELRDRLSRPVENIKPSYITRSSQLPIPVRRRARSTPPPAGPPLPRRLRPLPDSAPLPGISPPGREFLLKRLSPIPLSDKEGTYVGGSRLAGGVVGGSRGDAAADGGMLRMCCCPRPAVHPSPASDPAPPLALDLVADLPLHTRDSSAFTTYDEKTLLSNGKTTPTGKTEKIFDETLKEAETPQPPPPRSPSICVEDYSEKTNASIANQELKSLSPSPRNHETYSRNDLSRRSSIVGSQSAPSSPISGRRDSSRSRVSSPASVTSDRKTPNSAEIVEEQPPPRERDVRAALAECVLPARHEDWEAIVASLVEIERLACDAGARAPASSWRAAARGSAAHVRSLRSRVARAACRTVGALFEHRGRALDPELEEAAGALLERCADANRFLRGDAASALCRVACGSATGRAAVALVRRGGTHRAGPVRAAAAAALARLVRHAGASRALELPPEPRAMLLRAAGDLLGDACAEARVHARQLCLVLAEDHRFRPLLKEAMPPTRYRAVEKLVDKLRTR